MLPLGGGKPIKVLSKSILTKASKASVTVDERAPSLGVSIIVVFLNGFSI